MFFGCGKVRRTFCFLPPAGMHRGAAFVGGGSRFSCWCLIDGDGDGDIIPLGVAAALP